MKLTKTLITTSLFGAFIFSFHSTAWADTLEQQFQQGLEATERGDYQTAFKLWLPLAEQGNATSQLLVGMMYFEGQGVKQDDFEAVKWFRKAAEQGNAYAQNKLGTMYYYGRGVPQDDSEAVKWIQKAAEQGDSDAQYNIGVCYYNGNGVEKSKTNAIYWFRKACNNFEDKACEALNKIK